MRVSFEEAIRRGWIKPGEVQSQPKKSSTHRQMSRQDREGEEQSALIEAFAASYPDFAHLLIHIPNGGSRRNRFEGYRLKRQGVKAGVSDLLLSTARGGFFGLWIEFKATPPYDAPVTDAQWNWISDMKQQGYRAEVCRGAEAAMEVLSDYLALSPTQSLKG